MKLSDPAVVVLAALTAWIPGCGSWPDTGAGAGQSATTAAFSTAPTVPGPELARMWRQHWSPCEHPVGVTGLPADPYHLLRTGMWPTVDEITARLTAVTATGDPKFILDRLRVLGAVVLQMQSEIADQVSLGTHEIDAVGSNPAVQDIIRDQRERSISRRHDNYVAAMDHVIGELKLGAVLPSAQIGHRFRLDRVCPPS